MLPLEFANGFSMENPISQEHISSANFSTGKDFNKFFYRIRNVIS